MLLKDISDNIVLFPYTGETAKDPIIKLYRKKPVKKGDGNHFSCCHFQERLYRRVIRVISAAFFPCSMPVKKTWEGEDYLLTRPKGRDRVFDIDLS